MRGTFDHIPEKKRKQLTVKKTTTKKGTTVTSLSIGGKIVMADSFFTAESIQVWLSRLSCKALFTF